jgi:eukaryotic-like serine/threonine-protein kinase
MGEAARLDDRYLDQPYELSERLIDPIGGSVTCAGERSPLKRKHLEVLACLASATETMVSRTALIERVWNGNALVGENGLTNAVYYLRRALHDTDADKPLIRTIPRRGYQLTVEPRLVERRAMAAFSPGLPVAGKPEWSLSQLLGSSPVSETWLAQEQGSQAQRVFRFCRSEQHLRVLQRETKVMRYLREALAGRKDTAIILDWQLDEPPYYLEMKYAAHGTLTQWAASRGGLNQVAQGKRMRLTGEVADALAAVHAASVVHRNLAATSILIDDDDDNDRVHATLGEFGWSDLTDRTPLESMKITSAGLTLIGDEGTGEQLYLAPECVTGQAATSASDVYALGVLLLQMVVGDLQRTVDAGWERDVVSEPLRALIAACTDAQAERRPSAADVAHQLHAFGANAATERPAISDSADKTPEEQAAQRPSDPAASSAVTSSAPVSMIGQTIGPYRLLDPLGEGGMGTVYLAEQTEPVRRKVALKLVKTGMDSKQVLARFEAERQALALMSHANVATVYEAGSTSSGQPYFAMEYVRGLDITAHCDQLQMDFRDRIALFLQACEGVLHAHQKGLIHRDLKPGNILVSRAQDQPATVKIIDFGVAKSLSGVLTGHAAHTRLGSFVGTPAYSSPEQVSGPLVNVDTRADIYSLGVVLYQLLAGVTPYSEEELNRKTPIELARLLSGERPPSLLARFSSLSVEDEGEIARHRSLSVERMKAILGTDVSWIVGKCLERDPDDRYPSVLELEKDLRRWLDDKPVEARPTSRMYRARKFVRRHRLGVALGTAMTLALLVTTATAVHGLQVARKATAEAEMAADFQVKQMQSLDPAAMGIGLRSRLIKAALTRTAQHAGNPVAVAQSEQRLEKDIEDVNFTDLTLDQLDTYSFKPALSAIKKDFGNHPLLQARLWQTMADTMMKLGRYDAAVEPQRLALEQRRRLLGADDPLTLASLRSRGELHNFMGQLDQSAADLQTAMTGMRRALGNDDPETLRSIDAMGVTKAEQGKYDAAEALYREVLAGRRRVLGNDHPETLLSVGNVGQALFQQGKFKEALPFAREALVGSRRVLGNAHPDTLNAAAFMAAMHWSMGKYAEAADLQRESVEGLRRLRGDRHPETLAMINNLTTILKDAGRLDEAEVYVRRSLEIERTLYGADHPDRLSSLDSLGGVLREQGRLAEAESVFREVFDGRRRTLGNEHPDTLMSADDLADVLRSQGKLDESIALYEKTLPAMRRVLGKDHQITLLVARHLAGVLQLKGDFDAANALYEEVLQAQRRTLGDANKYTLGTIASMGGLAKAQGDLKRAEALLREALAGNRRVRGNDDQATLIVIDALSQVLRERGALDEAATLGRELIETAPRVLDTRDHDLARFFTHHGRTLLDLRQFEDAESMFEKARVNLLQGDAPAGKPVEQLTQGYIALYEQWQAHDAQADVWRKKLDALKKGSMQPAAVLAEK